MVDTDLLAVFIVGYTAKISLHFWCGGGIIPINECFFTRPNETAPRVL